MPNIFKRALHDNDCISLRALSNSISIHIKNFSNTQMNISHNKINNIGRFYGQWTVIAHIGHDKNGKMKRGWIWSFQFKNFKSQSVSKSINQNPASFIVHR